MPKCPDYWPITLIGLPYYCVFDAADGRPWAIIPHQADGRFSVPRRSYLVADMPPAVQTLIAASLDLACPSIA